MIKDMVSVIDEITKNIKNNMDVAVLGLSGGVDSTVCACLLVKALGSENVHTLHMPYNEVDTDTPLKFNSNSMRIAQELKTPAHWKPIKKIADAINSEVYGEFTHSSVPPLTSVNEGNARARARMAVLYGTAHNLETNLGKRVRVVGTGNLSEDFIGYDTKGGDALADLFIIGSLFKSEVYQLADHFVTEGMIKEDMVDRVPSAGLWEGQTDEDELGFSYNDMEPIIKEFLKLGNRLYIKELLNDRCIELLNTDIGKFVYDMHLKNKHKHEAPAVVNLREFTD